LGGVSFIMQNELTVRATTLTGNRGAVNIDGDPVEGVFGGLWLSDGTTLTLENSTFDDNQPSGLDVFNDGGNTVRNVTFVASRPNGDLTIDNSLFVDTECGDALPGADNLQWPAGGDCAGGTTSGDPELGDLGDNGGQTPTRMPAAGGAAAGVAHDCPDTDQRGEPRAADACAAGAVEP
ncbi:MAG TPA: right-handed parallel beta-helix repeat-containing protein, partial [Kofleriaceae bacterium]|nr:right-handed parallel beta-helix repeat-containing protein [Kofleriaceae bacterium]